MAKKMRTVLVGCGSICNAWMNSEAAKKHVELVGFVDINREAAEQRRDDFGFPEAEIGTDLEQVLTAVDPEVVFNCTIPEAHCATTLTALRHGCHVLGEKPLADSMVNARKMVAAARKADKIFAVIQNRRYQPQIRGVRKFLESGAIGDVTTVQSNFFIGAHFGGFRDEMEHVLLLDMAIHTFDAARLITGADGEAVYCHEWNPKGSWFRHGASAVAIFEMSGGIEYTYQGSWCAEGMNTSWECEWRIVGTQGSVFWDGKDSCKVQVVSETGGFLSQLRDRKVPLRGAKRLTGGHGGVIGNFIECVRTGKTPETVASDNIKSLAMVFGAIESAEKRRRVLIKV